MTAAKSEAAGEFNGQTVIPFDFTYPSQIIYRLNW